MSECFSGLHIENIFFCSGAGSVGRHSDRRAMLESTVILVFSRGIPALSFTVNVTVCSQLLGFCIHGIYSAVSQALFLTRSTLPSI
jgi:hypothetical protein